MTASAELLLRPEFGYVMGLSKAMEDGLRIRVD
jgi:hypothetical protein